MTGRALAWIPQRPGTFTDDPWWHRAACAGTDPELFFSRPETPVKTAAAKAVCSGCPVTEQCLRDAVAAEDAHAIRAGMTPEERREAYPPPRRCRLGRHVLTGENTGARGRCLACGRERDARRRMEERIGKFGTTAPQHGRRAA